MVVVRLRKDSLYDMTNEQRHLLRNALKQNVNDRYRKKKKPNRAGEKRESGGDESGGKTQHSGTDEVVEADKRDTTAENEENEEEQEEEEAGYIVHLKNLGELLNGMGSLLLPKNINNSTKKYGNGSSWGN